MKPERELLPPPSVFGLTGFDTWRPYQAEAAQACTDSPYRFVVLVAPTGSGKSLTYLTTSVLRNQRAVILTSTKGLQNQLARDYASLGMVDIRGKANYECVALRDGSTCEQAPCSVGVGCTLRHTECKYYSALRAARKAPLVVTNYACWLNLESYTDEGLGRCDLLVCDEAHAVPSILSSFLEFKISRKKMPVAGYLPSNGVELDKLTTIDWVSWAKSVLPGIVARVDKLQQYLKRTKGGNRAERKEYLQLCRFYTGLAQLVKAAPDEWISAVTPDEVQLTPIWPAKYSSVLFRNVQNVICTSATVCRKTMALLGVVDDMELLEYPHTFPLQNRRLTHIPTVRLNYRTDKYGMRKWLMHIDQIIDSRRDRKGLLHTISYARRDFVLANSRHADIMLTHQRANTEFTVRRFKTIQKPQLLVSPSMGTGWDFPYTECEYQIIGKVPYPDTTDKITKARCKSDRDYAGYIAMQELVQACGRGVRAPDDHCETFIVDDNALWFIPRNRQFAPDWFMEQFQSRRTIPQAPPRLNTFTLG